jgi:hypothetical protein
MDREHLPSARVVRESGGPVLPLPRVPMAEQVRRALAPVASHGRAALANVLGMWPLTAIMAVCAALIWSAGT